MEATRTLPFRLRGFMRLSGCRAGQHGRIDRRDASATNETWEATADEGSPPGRLVRVAPENLSRGNQARGRAMGQEAPFVVGDPTFGDPDPAASVQHGAFRPDQASLGRDR